MGRLFLFLLLIDQTKPSSLLIKTRVGRRRELKMPDSMKTEEAFEDAQCPQVFAPKTSWRCLLFYITASLFLILLFYLCTNIHLARWFGLNRSKYQWAFDDYCESKGSVSR